MFIILEGVDGAGKTTLTHQLAAALRKRSDVGTIETLHKGPPTAPHPLQEYVTPIVDYLPGRGRTVIADRWHWGERIYPKILGRPTLFDRTRFIYTEQFLAARGAIVVHVNNDLDIIEERITSRGDALISESQLRHIWLAYYDVAKTSILNNYYALSNEDINVVDHIIEEATNAEASAEIISTYASSYVGVINPTRLFVISEGVAPEQYSPTAMPFPGSANEIFHGIVDDEHVGFVRAHDTAMRQLQLALNRPPITAIGIEAIAACQLLDDQDNITYIERPVGTPKDLFRYRQLLMGEYSIYDYKELYPDYGDV